MKLQYRMPKKSVAVRGLRIQQYMYCTIGSRKYAYTSLNYPSSKNHLFTSPPHFLINFQPINKMPSKPVTARRRLASEIHASILALREAGQTYGEIARQMKLSRSTVTTIVHRATRQRNASPAFKKRMGRPSKLNDREKRAFIRHIELNPTDNLTAFATPSKSGHQLSRNTVRKYMKFAGFFRFKARKKSYLTVRHKANRLIWARKHKHWTVKN